MNILIRHSFGFTLIFALMFSFIADGTCEAAGTPPVVPNIIHVDDNAPGDPGPFNPNISDPCERGTLAHPFDTIQEGINVASNGDLVKVFPGVYTEAIDFLGKAITVTSFGDAAVIRAPADYAVSFINTETSASVLRNFVIRDSSIGVFIVDSFPSINNVTVVKNEFGIVSYSAIAPDINSCILWFNTDGDLYGCEARFSCIQRGSPGEGNISAYPKFADANNNDYHLRSARGRYWPSHDIWVLDNVSSPCVDAGDPNANPNLEPRPNGGRINMGAYGSSSYASLSENDVFPDFNGDNFVNWADFAVFASYWLRSYGD